MPHVAVLPDGSRVEVSHSPLAVPAARALASVPEPRLPDSERARGDPAGCRCGRVAGARSGDKGGDANLGVWVEDERAWPWLAHFLTADTVRALLPETAGLELDTARPAEPARGQLIVRGLLGEGVAYNARFDPQAKALGELLRSRFADIPESLR